ncbi:hypothetical protein [Thermosporothrix hazakensis]|nr:hypothetical protein [Thermosporothrix hazakensis]
MSAERFFKPVVVKLPFGTFQLRQLRLRDVSDVEQTGSQELSARQYAEMLLDRMMIEPRSFVERIGDVPDEQIQAILLDWWNQQFGKEYPLSEDATLQTFQDAVEQHMLKLVKSFKQDVNQLTRSFQSTLDLSKPINEVVKPFRLSSSMQNLFPSFKFQDMLPSFKPSLLSVEKLGVEKLLLGEFTALSRYVQQSVQALQLNWLAPLSSDLLRTQEFFQRIPDLSQLRQMQKEEGLAGESLLEYVERKMTMKELLEIVGMEKQGQHDPQVALDMTHNPSFMELLFSFCEHSEVLRPRLPALREGLAVYLEKRYYAAIPSIIPQLEGVIGDFLLLRDMVVLDGHTIYRRGPDGRPALNKKNKPIKLSGLRDLMNESGWANDSSFSGIAAVFTNWIIPRRNGVMHGRDHTYGEDPQFAANCLCILRYFIEQMHGIDQ